MKQLEYEDEAKLKQYSNEEKEIQRLKRTKEKMKNWVKGNSGLAARYQGIKKRITEYEDNRTQIARNDNRNLSLSDNTLRVKALISMLSIPILAPDNQLLYKTDNIYINKGDRVAILGKNGSGKTTLLNTLYRNENDKIKFNPQVKVGYYRQDFSDMDQNQSIQDYFADANIQQSTLTSQLVAAGFPYQYHTKKIGNLSGGEKSRLKFLKLKLVDPNFYFLDEPTNHIDVQGIESLERDISLSSATF